MKGIKKEGSTAKISQSKIGILFLIFLAANYLPVYASSSEKIHADETGRIHEITSRIAGLAVPFAENRGQIDNETIQYYTWTHHGTFAITYDGRMAYTLFKKSGQGAVPPAGWVIQEMLQGAQFSGSSGKEKTSAKMNYMKGHDPSCWRVEIPTFRSLSLGQVYPDIQLSLKASESGIEKIFRIGPNGCPKDIRLHVKGASDISLNENGELELTTGIGQIAFTKPIAYQEIDGKRITVPVAYCLADSQLSYGFSVGHYDTRYSLVIDPLLASTYIGGKGGDNRYTEGRGSDYVHDIALDSLGNVYVVGSTASSDFPTTPGAYDTSFYIREAFVSKFNSDLTELIASTFILSGYTDDVGDLNSSIAISPQNEVIVAGELGGIQRLLKLNSDLTQLLGSTDQLSGATIRTIAVGKDGSIYAAGETNDPNFPVAPGSYDTSYNGGTSDAFVMKFNSNLNQIIASTFLGGTSDDYCNALAIDSQGNVVLGGYTYSSDFPTTAGAYNMNFVGPMPGFVSKLTDDLSRLSASTYLGSQTYIHSVATDESDNVLVSGHTYFMDFPTTPGAYKTNPGNIDGRWWWVFASKLSSDLTQLDASTFIGNTYFGYNYKVSVGPHGTVVVTGSTSDSTFPITPGAYDNSINGDYDGFVSILTSNLNLLLYSTFIGGGSGDFIGSMAIDNQGHVYVAGYTGSFDFPTTPEAYNPTIDSTGNYVPPKGFVVKLGMELEPSYRVSEYLPLVPGTSWTYLINGTEVVERRVLSETVAVGGIQTHPIQYVQEKVTEYMTSDSSGVILYRQYQPNVNVQGKRLDIDVIFSPPIKIADGEAWIGQSFYSSGNTDVKAGKKGASCVYTALTTLEATEDISVTAGSFETIRIRQAVELCGYTFTTVRNVAKSVGVIIDETTNSEGLVATSELVSVNEGFRNLAIIKISAPKSVTLKGNGIASIGKVKVVIQNRGQHTETIEDATMLNNLITLQIESLGLCTAPQPTLNLDKLKTFPVAIKPKGKLTVTYDVNFDCANDPTRGTPDYRFKGKVNRVALDGKEDHKHFDDTCPRDVTPPYVVEPLYKIKDKGCGAKKPDGTLGGGILTDVIVK